LRESEARYRALADVSPQIVFMADKDGQRTWFNHYWHDLSDLTLEQSVGSGWLQAVQPDHREARGPKRGRLGSRHRNAISRSRCPICGEQMARRRWHLSRTHPLRGP
jgi:PAS domain S-box-containing protein